jgi:hypothetical protein
VTLVPFQPSDKDFGSSFLPAGIVLNRLERESRIDAEPAPEVPAHVIAHQPSILFDVRTHQPSILKNPFTLSEE